MSKKYLLINLHTSNHGDEAAGKAFIEKSKFTDDKISIIYNSNCKIGIPNFNIDFTETLLSQTLTKIDKILIVLSFYLPISFLKTFFTKKLKDEFNLINNSDIVISMPGGANLGLYKDWRYLWRLFISKRLNKKTILYSVSIGSFNKDDLFYKLTKKTLLSLDFVSLRDAQSFRYGDEMGLNYVKSIDTAYLNQPSIDNFNLSHYDIKFLEDDFIVFVPNNLTKWHPTFRSYSSKKLLTFYENILNIIIGKKLKVLFLPQLFGCGDDKSYFNDIVSSLSDDIKKEVTIVDENYSSDVQQNIIKKSKFVIGARYHSIVFSINNNKQFISLSYENKMKNMLEILALEDYSLDMTKLPTENIEELYLSKISNLVDEYISKPNHIENDKPIEMAKSCFTKLKQFLVN